MGTALQRARNCIKAEIESIHNVFQIAQWIRLALDFFSTTQLHNLYTT
jgi:hypothetical protein